MIIIYRQTPLDNTAFMITYYAFSSASENLVERNASYLTDDLSESELVNFYRE